MRRRDVLGVLGGAIAGTAGRGNATSDATDQTNTAADFAPLGSVDLRAAAEGVVSEDGTTAFVATMDGFVSVDVADPAAPRVLAHREVMGDFEDGPLRGVADLSLDGDRLLVGGPFRGGGELRGFALYDVGDPADPGRLLAHETASGHHNLFYRDGVAYVTRGGPQGSTFVQFDVTGDAARELGAWSVVDADERWAAVPARLRPIHDLWVHGDVAYLVHWDAGTFVVDVADPAAPRMLSRVGGRPRSAMADRDAEGASHQLLEPPGNHHFATVDEAGDLLAVGKESWDVAATDRAGGPSGVDLWDVSDPANPERRGSIAPPPTPEPTWKLPDTTAHNLDLHGGRLFSAWYNGGVKIHDVSDPTAPEELAWWRAPGETSFWTAQRATDEFFVATSTSLGKRSARPALYTFPNRPGEQADPPTLAPPGGSPTRTADRSRGSGATESDEGLTADQPGRGSALAPGFGVLGGLAALGLAAWRRRRD